MLTKNRINFSLRQTDRQTDRERRLYLLDKVTLRKCDLSC